MAGITTLQDVNKFLFEELERLKIENTEEQRKKLFVISKASDAIIRNFVVQMQVAKYKNLMSATDYVNLTEKAG